MAEPFIPCFHCGEPCLEQPVLYVERAEERVPVCCGGCQAVSELIMGSGLDRYYQFRKSEAIKAPQEAEKLGLAWQACDERRDLWGVSTGEGSYDLLLQTEGIRCAACAWLIRSRLEPMQGVERVSVDIGTGYTRIVWQPEQVKLSELALELARIGYKPHLPLAGEEERRRLLERRQSMRRMGVAGLGMMQVMMYAVGLYAGDALGIGDTARRFLEWISLLVTIPVVFFSGRVFFSGAIDGLKAGRLGMDVPVALAIALAFTMSCVNFLRGQGDVYFDSVVMFIFFLGVARHIQLVQRHRNIQASSALARLLPEWAERLLPGGTETILAADLLVGDQVRVKPGNPFPADGVISQGSTDVDEALLTGESALRFRQAGDPVIGGSINNTQPVSVTIEAVGGDMTLSTLGQLLARARTEGSKTQLMAEKIAGYFVLGVLLFAGLSCFWWSLQDPDRIFPVLLAVLVVSCPCALSLATPAALAAAGRRLLREGILLTRGDSLEALARIDTVLLDKTGTLTRGQPEIDRIEVNPDRVGMSQESALQVAAALESFSAHPLAHAFQAIEHELEVFDPQAYPNAGLSGVIAGKHYRLGSAVFALPAAQQAQSARPGIWLSDENGWIARFELIDRLRHGARETIRDLQQQGLGIIILSGDDTAAVEDVALRLSVGEWKARQSPEMKMQVVQELQQAGKVVLMIGDGVNDAPVLGAADVSMTVKGAAELANSAADLILNGDSLSLASSAMITARETRRVIRQNFVWAIAYNLTAVSFAFAGAIQPWMAALGMSASSLLVVANAARLARGKGESVENFSTKAAIET